MEPVSLPVAGTDRRYLLYRPAAAAGLTPVVVVLHGTGGTAAWADGETGWSAFAEREGFLLALPDALPPDPAKPPRFLTNPQRWNDGSESAHGPWSAVQGQDARDPGADTKDPGLRTVDRDVAFLAAVVGDLIRRGADPARVYLTGFSNGAGMAFRFAAERADLVAAVAPVAGYCWVEPRPSRPVPTLYLVGTADPLIPIRGGPVKLPWGGRLVRRPPVAQTLERWAAAIGCRPVPGMAADRGGVREEVYPGPVEFRAVYVEGLGHHWPGGKGQLNHRIGGRPSDRVNANEVIWGFFRRTATGRGPAGFASPS